MRHNGQHMHHLTYELSMAVKLAWSPLNYTLGWYMWL
jgi:hypothetical protein